MSDPLWEPAPLLVGDYTDDDGDIVDSLVAANTIPPDPTAAFGVVVEHSERPVRLERMFSGYQTFDSQLSIPVAILPPDVERQSLFVSLYGTPNEMVVLADSPDKLAYVGRSGQGYQLRGGSSLSLGDYTGPLWAVCPSITADNWITILPRQTVNGQTNVFGTAVDLTPYSSIKFYNRIYSVSGTTPSVTIFELPTRDGTTPLTGTSIYTSSALTTAVITASSVLNPPGTGMVIPFLSMGSGSADQSIDVEIYAYVEYADDTPINASSVVLSWAAVTK